MKKITRSLLSALLAMLVMVGVISPMASAIQLSGFKGDNDVWLVDANTHRSSSTINLYGRADYLCLKMKNDKKTYSIYYFEMYSDSSYKNKIAAFSTGGDNKEYLTLSMSFDNLKSGTYYAKTYVYKETIRSSRPYYFDAKKDPSTERKYTIKINKKGTDIDDMNTVMYGFENTEKGPAIYWYSVPGATGYHVYRKNTSTGKYDKIGSAKDSGEKLSFYVDKELKGINATRSYKVVAYKGSLKTPHSLLPMKVKAYKAPVVKVESAKNNFLKISWSKVASNAKYYVYMCTDNTDWKKVKTTNSLSYEISMKDRDSNVKYYFTVIAEINGIYSAYDESGKSIHYLEAATLKDCTYPKDGGITVNWSKVKGADSYRIYRHTETEKKWVKLVEVGNVSSYTDKTANAEDYYYYTVRPMRKGKTGSYDYKGIPGTILTKPELYDIVELGDNTIRLSWSEQPNNCEYLIYDKISGSWSRIGVTRENYFDYKLPYEIGTHIFTSKPYRKPIAGEHDNKGVTYQSFPQINLTYCYADTNGMNFVWEKPNGAGDSVIFRKTADSEYEQLAQISENRYCDTTAENGVEYTYKIAYLYNDEVIEKSAVEKVIGFSDETVEIVEKEYDIYVAPSGFSKNGYNLEIKDYNPSAVYVLYEKTKNGWVKCRDQKSYKEGTVFVTASLNGSSEYALQKIDGNGIISKLPEQGMVVNGVYSPSEMSLSFKNGDATITWSTENLTFENVIIYRNKTRIAVVPASDGKYVDKDLGIGAFYTYVLRGESNGFASPNYLWKECAYLEAPKVKVSENENGLKISWSNVGWMTSYAVYRKSATQTSWKRIASIPSYDDDFYFIDKNVNDMEEYTYTVKALYKNSNNPYDKEGVKYTYIVSPKFTTKNTSSGVKITIEEKAGVDGYVIKEKIDGKWKTIKTLDDPSKTTYTDKNVVGGQKKQYVVLAYKGDCKGYRTRGNVHYFLEQPEITSLTKTSKGVKVKFDKVEGAAGYYVYRKAAGSTKWTKVTTTKSLEFVDTKVKSGVKYTYTVKAYCSNKTIESAYNKTGWSITYKK